MNSLQLRTIYKPFRSWPANRFLVMRRFSQESIGVFFRASRRAGMVALEEMVSIDESQLDLDFDNGLIYDL